MNSIYDITLKFPRRMLIYGPSGSGKSTFVEKMLFYMKDLFGFNFDNIVYCSGESFPAFDEIFGISINKVRIFNKELLEEFNPENKNLLILDDNMHSFVNDKLISDLFTKISHHKNIFVILLVQNLFPKGKYIRDLSTNSTYIVLMSNPRENLQIRTLSSQIDGADPKFVLNCYTFATKNKPYAYLFLDFDQETPVEIRVRTNIFPDEETTIAFVKISQV